MTAVNENAGPEWYAVYTRATREVDVAHEIGTIDGVKEVLLPIFHHLKPRPGAGARVIGANELMFPNYVMLRALLDRDLMRELLGVDGAQYLLGTTPERPSKIPESEIALIKHLADSERDPRLGEAPQKGRVARVMAGPLTGIEGLVLWRNRHEARLMTKLRMAAGGYELRLPLDVLALSKDCKWSTGEDVQSAHRGGRRVRRGRSMTA